MLKRTPLFETHRRLGARLVEFGGWEMPVQYTSIVDEHRAVRSAAGVFDISHMGEVLVRGAGALAFLNQVLTNDLAKLGPGQGQYTLMCRETGGVVDDLYAYCLADSEYLLIINASRIEPDVAWLETQLEKFPTGGVRLENASEQFAAVAVQGPGVAAFIDRCFPGSATGGTAAARVTGLVKNQIGRWIWRTQPVWIARTGYTGEDGFEIVAATHLIVDLWESLMSEGAEFGLKPAGLGARDTLRTEVCYPLYGHELTETTTPIEAGLGAFVASNKGDFPGRAVLESQKLTGPARRCVAFKMTDKSAPPRPGYPILSTGSDARKIGEVVSGTQSPSLGIGIGMGYVPATCSQPESPIQIEIRGRPAPAVIVRKPIYKKAI